MIAIFQPLVGVGNFLFNVHISKYFHLYNFTIYKKDGKYDCDKYVIDNPDLSLYVNDYNVIESINCREECIYKGRNIIGMNIEVFMDNESLQPDGDIDHLELNDKTQDIYEFDDIGLQVWCKNDIIITVIASPYIEDE